MTKPAHPSEQSRSNATYFAGDAARPQTVTVYIDTDDQCLVAVFEDDSNLSWPLSDLRDIADQAGNDLVILRRTTDPVQRLVLTDRSLLPHLPNRTKTVKPAPRGKLFGWALAAVASVALIIFVLVPTMANQLARFIPPEGEQALGEVTLNQIRKALVQSGFPPVPFCDKPAGQAALDKIETRLQAALPERHDITVSVLNHKMINAFALPGNNVVFFKGLIDNAQTPEELAAVFAHEIGHVVSRDPTRHALRSAGSLGVLGLLFGDFAGGAVVLLIAERLIEANYSQEAESRADIFAHEVLINAGIAPSALAAMFERFREIGKEATPFLSHFLSHPALGDRIQAARDATPSEFVSTPVLTADEWQALQSICD
ncbi:M48 family metallopeptidase [Marivita sp. S0852]|uniref:M48 family metallopeptidase n=1 Tax=Marivita sp. S0852 TaxID=3373893 RepID=UPI003981B2BC